MSDNAFIVMLSFGALLLSGMLIVAHVSAYRLKQRLQLRRDAGAPATEAANVAHSEFDLGTIWYGHSDSKPMSVQVRHAETAR